MKTTLMMTLALLLCISAPCLLAQQANAPLFDAQGVPTRDFVSSLQSRWTHPIRGEKEVIFFNVHTHFPRLSDNDRKRFHQNEEAPFELTINFYTRAETDSRITHVRRGQSTSTADTRRSMTNSTPIRATINFLLVDENNNVVKKMAADSARFNPLRDKAKFGTYTLYAWTKHHNGMFGAVTNFSLYVPPVTPTMPAKK